MIILLHSEQKCAVEKGDVRIVLISPEAIFESKWRHVLEQKIYRQNVKAIVVDEAHCIIEW
jgi:superfamily II DNA helicase RecQ